MIWNGCLSYQEIYRINSMMSYNIMSVSARLAINDVVQASSVNAIGMRKYILNSSMTDACAPELTRIYTVGSESPAFDYLPLDEKHPCRPEAAYDLSKQYAHSNRLRFPNQR